MAAATPQSAPQVRPNARAIWSAGNFSAIASVGTMIPAAQLVDYVRVRPGETVLDIGTGTGAVAITAARRGAKATGLDITPELLQEAQANAALANVDVAWREGDAEALPYPDASFDVVVSQFGHMFAPNPEAAAREIVRVLKPGGRLGISTWPPDHFVGRMFLLNGRYNPPPPGVASPAVWGTPENIRRLLGSGVRDLHFTTGLMSFPALSPQHYQQAFETNFGPIVRLLAALDPTKREAWRRDYAQLIAEYFEDNQVRQEFLMTRAIKA